MESNHRILHDAYFNKKPRLVALLAVRLVLLCSLCVSSVMMFADFYGLSCGRGETALISFAASALMYITASLLPPYIAYGGTVILCGVIGFIFRKKIADLAVLFWNYIMLSLESRLLSTERFVVGDLERFKSGALDSELKEGCLFGVILISVFFAVAFTAYSRCRCRVSLPVFLTILFSAPAFAAERATFTPFALIFISSVFALRSIVTSYELDKSFVFGGGEASKRAEKKGERAYRAKTRLFAFSKKLRSDVPRYGKYTSNAVATVIISMAVFSTAFYILPRGKGIDYNEILDTFFELGNSAAEKIGDIWNDLTGRVDERSYFSGSGLMGSSSEIAISSPSEKDREVLAVTLDRNDIPVYLRGDIGVSFTGSSWTSVSTEYQNAVDEDGNKYSELLADFYPEEEYQYLRLCLLTGGEGSPDDIIPLQRVALEYKRNTRVVFQPLAPYEPDYKKNIYFDAFGDFILRAKQGSGYMTTFESMALTPRISERSYTDYDKYQYDEIMRTAWLFDLYDDNHDSEYTENINIYRDFVYKTYTTSDAVVDDIMHEILSRGVAKFGSAQNTPLNYSTALDICDYFRENYTYTLDKEESGENLYDFLYTTKKGHCAMFASAMTLCLRHMGIPARYVTGYVVSGSGEKTEDGYRYVLRERDLHAWVEVYFFGAGWLPFDPTAASPDSAGYIGANNHNTVNDTPNEDAPAEETTVPEDEETGTETSESEESTLAPPDGENADGGSGSSGGTADGGFPWEYLPAIIAAGAVLILIISGVLFVKTVERAEKRAFESFRRRSPTEATALMYRFILAMLKNNGLTPQNEFLYDFARRVDEDILMKGSNAFMRDIVAIIEKCEFGTEEISPVDEDERKAVYKYASAVYAHTVRHLSPIKQFFAKISLFM